MDGDFWESAARRDPLWAILSDPSKRGRRWELQGFFETGRREISLLLYQLKQLKTEGTSVLSFHNRASAERHSFIAFNLGDFYRQYGRDPNYFRAVNLGDATFQQREVRVNVDGGLAADFERRMKGELPDNWSAYVATLLDKVNGKKESIAVGKIVQREKVAPYFRLLLCAASRLTPTT